MGLNVLTTLAQNNAHLAGGTLYTGPVDVISLCTKSKVLETMAGNQARAAILASVSCILA